MTILPGFVFINSLQASTNNFSDCPCKVKHKKFKFKLKHFEGDWVICSQSTGGVSGNSGYSSNLIGQFSLGLDGIGNESFVEQVLYMGPLGTALTVQDFSANHADVSLIIIDEKSGIVNIIIDDRTTGRHMEFTFIAFVSDGKVTELVGHDTTMPSPSSVQSVFVRRQVK